MISLCWFDPLYQAWTLSTFYLCKKKAKLISFKHFIWLGSSWPFKPLYPKTRWARRWSRAFSQNKVRDLWTEIWFAENVVAYTYRPKKSFLTSLLDKNRFDIFKPVELCCFLFLSKCLSDWLTNPSLTDRGSHHVKLSSPSCLRAFKNFSRFHIFAILFVSSIFLWDPKFWSKMIKDISLWGDVIDEDISFSSKICSSNDEWKCFVVTLT